MSQHKRLFRNFLYLFSSNVAGQLFFLLGVVRLARVFGPELFGVWNVAQAFLAYFFRLGEMGLEVVGIRAVAQAPERMSSWVSNVVGVRLVLALGVFALAAALSLLGLFPGGTERLVVIFALSLFPMALILEWVFESQQSVVVVSIARILKGLAFFVLCAAFITDAGQVEESAYYYVASILLSSALVFAAAMSRVRVRPGLFDRSQARKLLAEALPVGLVTLLSQYSLYAGTFIVGYLVQSEVLGYYTASHRLVVFLWAYGITTSTRVILPQLSILHNQSNDMFASFIKKYFKILAFVAFLVGIVAMLGGEQIVLLCYGDAYRGGIGVFKILSVALVIAILRSILETGLIAANRQHQLMRGTAGLAVLYTVFTIAFSSLWGIEGTAFAAVLSEALYALYLAAVVKFVSPAEMIRLLWKPLASSAVIVGAFLGIGFGSAYAAVPAACVLFVASLLLTGEIARSEIDMIKHVLSPDR